MEKLSMCRICLAEDGLCSVVGSHLQEMYESLVICAFETKDSKPELVCYICCARLQNCYELRKSCLQSEELFTQLLNCNMQVKPVPHTQEGSYSRRLTITHPVIRLSVGSVLQLNPDNIEVKQEDSDEAVHSPRRPSLNTLRIQEDSICSDLSENKLAPVKVEDIKESTKKMTNEPTSALNDNYIEYYICDMCQECFTCKYSFESHIRLCFDMCKNGLSNRSSLNVHIHANTNERKPQCNVCKKYFIRNSYLNRHMRIHTGEKYQCNICYKFFTYKQYLVIHSRVHTGEKPYKCNVCDKAFTHSNYLKDHIRTHTKEKPYECNVCNKRFTQCGSLSRHARKH